nr:AAA family ATPase [Lachnospiraceae bacterium]
LDDGRITDSLGRTVDFKNTILIMTSNIGAPALLEGIQSNGEISEEAKAEVMGLLKGSFRPEFLNRLDEIVMFKPLTESNMANIARLVINDLSERLKDREISLTISDETLNVIAKNAYEPQYGARPLKRYIQKTIETEVAKLLLSDTLSAGDTIEICHDGDIIYCKKK